MRMSLPLPVLKALERLEQAGHAAYAVGGCVRDAVLGLTPEEYDLASAATPSQVTDVFRDARVIPTGIRHGTVTVVLDDMPLEITTFRRDGHYSDGRRPDRVRFSTSIMEDLARRDFTCNAMAYSPRRGLVDPHHGRQACHDKLLMAVGKPEERFQEDALRILRGLRFAAALEFAIHPDTYHGMLALMDNIRLVSRERVAVELDKLLLARQPQATLAAYPLLARAALPLLGNLMEAKEASQTQWQYALAALGRVPLDLALRWAALLHPAGPEAAREALMALRQPNSLSQEVHTLLTHLPTPVEEGALPRWLAHLGYALLEKLLRLQLAVTKAAQPDNRQATGDPPLLAAAQRVRDTHPCLSLKDLPVNGDDLLALGYAPGPALGQTLQWLFELVLDGKAPAQREALLRLARQRNV